MAYICLLVLYYHGNLYITEGAYPGGRGFPLSQRSFLLSVIFGSSPKCKSPRHITACMQCSVCVLSNVRVLVTSSLYLPQYKTQGTILYYKSCLNALVVYKLGIYPSTKASLKKNWNRSSPLIIWNGMAKTSIHDHLSMAIPEILDVSLDFQVLDHYFYLISHFYNLEDILYLKSMEWPRWVDNNQQYRCQIFRCLINISTPFPNFTTWRIFSIWSPRNDLDQWIVPLSDISKAAVFPIRPRNPPFGKQNASVISWKVPRLFFPSYKRWQNNSQPQPVLTPPIIIR